MNAPKAKRDKSTDVSRSQARLATVQALYQMDLAQTDLVEVIEEFRQHRLGASGDGNGMVEADQEHFAQVLRGVVKRQLDIDPLIDQQLATGWRLARIDSIVRAILRAATFELIALPDIPPRVIISEYIEVARAFFEGDEPRLVNGVLDQLARKLRPGTLPERD
ncbi:MAG TPA: transcription antitermination factor NusB [Methyloceanibacter sp.]|nr:transcription antitermination factor NusB [Methyloceanibacter sp.]